MNLPALSAAIVHAVRSSHGDSNHNLATVVQGMIQESVSPLQYELDTIKAILSDPSAVWVNMLRGNIAMPQAVEHGRECQSQLEQICNTLDNYWRENPDPLSAVQVAIADANKFRIQAINLREKHNKITEFIGKFLIPYRTEIARPWLDGFVECGAVTINWNYPYGYVEAVKINE